MERRPISSLRRFSAVVLACALMLGLSALASVVSGVGSPTASAVEAKALSPQAIGLGKELEDFELPMVDTMAYDPDTRDSIARANEQVIIKDEVFYENLEPNTEYTLNSTLVRKSDGATIATESNTFISEEEGWGRTTVDFVFDGTGLAGDSVVVFESIVLDGVEVAAHADINDEFQTVRLPKVETTAKDKADGDHQVRPDSEVSVVDRVAYTNLIPAPTDFDYTVMGTVVRKSDGQPLVVDGSVVTVSKTFAPKGPNGIVDLEFSFDASELAGEELVVFERVFYGDAVVAVHEDLEDAAQTIAVAEDPGTVSVTVGKAWLNAENWAQPAPRNWPRGVVVAAMVMNGQEAVAEVTLDAEHPTVTVNGLPRLKSGAYTVEEAQIEGVSALEEGSEVEVDAEGNVTAHLVSRLAPARSERALDVAKVDESGEPVKGAVLELAGAMKDGGSDYPAVQWTTNGELFPIANLVPGSYRLTEKQAPAGYEVAAPIDFVVDESGAVLLGGEPLLPAEGTGDLVLTMVDRRAPTGEQTPPALADSTTLALSAGQGSPVLPGQLVQPNAAGGRTGSGAVRATGALSRTGAAAGETVALMLALVAAGVLVRRRCAR